MRESLNTHFGHHILGPTMDISMSKYQALRLQCPVFSTQIFAVIIVFFFFWGGPTDNFTFTKLKICKASELDSQFSHTVI